MKAKMTVYQKGGKMPIVPDPKKKIVPDPKKNGTGLYFESKSGRIGRTYPLYGSAVEVQSMDTTGYGAGRQDFKLETSRPGLGKSSTPVKREDVLKTINKLKSGASKVAKFKNGGKMPIVPDPKKMPAHFTTDAAKLSKTPSEIELTKISFDQAKQMKDYKAAGRAGADQSGVFEQMKITNKRAYELEKKAAAERSAKEKAREAFMKKYEKGGKMNVAGAKVSNGKMSVDGKKKPGTYKYLGYAKGGKMKGC